MCVVNLSLAHDWSVDNRETIEASTEAGCFHCLERFSASEVTAFVDEGEVTALCPKCGVDAVIGDAAVNGDIPFQLSEAFLQAMYSRWFEAGVEATA